MLATTPSPNDPLPRPLPSVAPVDWAAWAARLDPAALPVLDGTADMIEEWRDCEDVIDAHLMAEGLAKDPLMTLKLLAHVAALRHKRGDDRDSGCTGAETVTAALVMLGISPFFAQFGAPARVGQQLAPDPAVREGFHAVLHRSHRAARFALSFAVHRLDHDAVILQEAALLHGSAELLTWLYAPRQALHVRALLAADASRRSAATQRQVFGVDLAALQHDLVRRWRLPPLLVALSAPHAQPLGAKARTVRLAIRLARHTARDWGNAAIADDVAEISDLLGMAREPTLDLLRDIDGEG
jgi:HD-like signal output (HDOD) protein